MGALNLLLQLLLLLLMMMMMMMMTMNRAAHGWKFSGIIFVC